MTENTRPAQGEVGQVPVTEPGAEELSDEQLDQVAGGAEPFLKLEGVDGESSD